MSEITALRPKTFPHWGIDALFAAMRQRVNVTIQDTQGKPIGLRQAAMKAPTDVAFRVWVNGIEAEDGSGQNWIIKTDRGSFFYREQGISDLVFVWPT